MQWKLSKKTENSRWLDVYFFYWGILMHMLSIESYTVTVLLDSFKETFFLTNAEEYV